MRVLHVDDDADDRAFFQEAVHAIDGRIVFETASNGAEALKKLTESTELPDLILLDINMPFIDGRECLEKIRSDKKLRSLPVVICSTSNYYPDIESFHQLEAGYITKPSDLNVLIQALKSYILPLQKKSRTSNYQLSNQ